MSNVIPLYPPRKSIQHLVRIGHTGHRTLENLYATGRASITTSVIDASHLTRQKELIDTLSNSGVEVILDTKSAELASLNGVFLVLVNCLRPLVIERMSLVIGQDKKARSLLN